ncbi:MAG: RNA polymerase sigma factor [Chitinophagales bacterium]|jgi:RNA polymerase sigma-70 factor (ECF subfamily)|nr:RNA polymerase sigma factor [Chitinophagales bacterium]
MRTKVEFNDQELIKMYVEGDVQALETLITKYQSKVMSSIYQVVKDLDTANDIFQETFIKVMLKLKEEKYQDQGKLLPWIQRIAHNLCMDHYRKNQKAKIIANDNEEFDIFDTIGEHDESRENEIVSDESNLDILSFIDLLPEEQQEVLIYRHFYDYSFKEISEITGMNLNTALGRMRYALINLKKIIDSNK